MRCCEVVHNVPVLRKKKKLHTHKLQYVRTEPKSPAKDSRKVATHRCAPREVGAGTQDNSTAPVQLRP